MALADRAVEEKGKEKIADGDDDDDEEQLAHILETEILAAGSESSDQEGKDDEEGKQLGFSKKPRLEKGGGILQPTSFLRRHMNRVAPAAIAVPPARLIDSGLFSMIPSELFHHILKFLSSEDLMSCSLVCSFMNIAASDESLWRRLYCMRWGMASPAGKLHTCPWKKLYIQRDREDMVDFVRNTPLEFREYYIQMQASKRSRAPLPSQVHDDSVILDKTVAEQVSIWKNNRGLTDDTVFGHDCSGKTCTYYHIGDVFLCEKTGRVHVCDDTCREVVLDLSTGTYVCTISGRCYDRWLSPDEEIDLEGQAGAFDELEPFMGSGRFARAYVLGYNCSDEKELETALRFC